MADGEDIDGDQDLPRDPLPPASKSRSPRDLRASFGVAANSEHVHPDRLDGTWQAEGRQWPSPGRRARGRAGSSPREWCRLAARTTTRKRRQAESSLGCLEPGAGGAPFDVRDTSPENEILRVMAETWPGQTVFLPLDAPLFVERKVAYNSEDVIYAASLGTHFDALLQYGLAHRMPIN